MGNTYSSSKEQEYHSYIETQFKTIQLQQKQIGDLLTTLQNSQNSQNTHNVLNTQINQHSQLHTQLETLRAKNLLEKKQYLDNLNKLKQYKQLQEKQHFPQLENKSIKIDPYQILGLPKQFTKTQLKKAYLQKALKYHPDRGGSPETFKHISTSYKYLLNVLEKSEYRDHQTLKQSLKKSEFHEQKPMNLDNFDVNKFNKVYEEHRTDNAYDRGYGDWMLSQQKQHKQKDFQGKFNKSKFHNEFESMKQSTRKQTSDQLSIMDPKQDISYKGSDQIVELGQKNVKNFSGGTGGLTYRDLKDAYENPTLIDVNSVDLSKRNTNMTSLKSERTNINYQMSTQESQKRASLENKLQDNEQKRLQRIRETDQMIFNQYKQIHNRLHN